jgi:hypothetical protein
VVLDEPQDNEILSQVNGFDILISEEIKRLAGASLIDYVNSPYEEGFIIYADFPA